MPVVNQVRYKPGREGTGSAKVTTQPVRLNRPTQAPVSNGPAPRRTDLRRGR